MGKLKIGLLYVSLHNQLKKNTNVIGIIDRKTFFCIIGKHFLIPKNLKAVIVKEMEIINLVKIEPSGNIKVLDCDIDMEKDVSKLYQMCGIF